MKKIAILLAIVFVTTTAFAQERQSFDKKQKPTVENRLAQMSSDLNLTNAQKKKVKALLEEQDKEMQGNKQSRPDFNNDDSRQANEPRPARKSNAENDSKGFEKRNNSEFNTKLKKILTTSQWTKWETLQKNNGGQFDKKKTTRKETGLKEAVTQMMTMITADKFFMTERSSFYGRWL